MRPSRAPAPGLEDKGNADESLGAVGSLTAAVDTCSWRFNVSRTAGFESSADLSLGKRDRHGGEEEEE